MKKIKEILLILIIAISFVINPMDYLSKVSASEDKNTFFIDMGTNSKISKDIEVNIPSIPEKADIVFCFDATGSMRNVLSSAQKKAINIMKKLNTLGADIHYGLVSYRDYDENSAKNIVRYPYKMNLALTSDINAVSKAINSVVLGSGTSDPEASARALYESYSDKTIGWREGTKKIFINFGDDLPHDNNVNEGISNTVKSTGIDAGRDGKVGTADDVDLQESLKNMKANNIILLACQTNNRYISYWSYWAGLTGGKAYNTNASNLDELVINAVKENLISENVENLRLEPTEEFKPWINSISPSSYSGQTGKNISFKVEISVPEGTKGGPYSYKVNAVDNAGVVYGTYTFNINYKYEYPVINVFQSKEDKIPGQVKLSVSAKSYIGDITKLKLPNGKIIEGSEAEFIVSKNGSYTFVAYDSKGHESEETILVSSIKTSIVLNVEVQENQVKVNDEVEAYLVIDNINNIKSEFANIKYDKTKLEFLNMELTDGERIIKSKKSLGQIEVYLSSKEKSNYLNNNKILLKLKFKAKEKGSSLIYVQGGKISNGINMERDLLKEECGGELIKIN